LENFSDHRRVLAKVLQTGLKTIRLSGRQTALMNVEGLLRSSRHESERPLDNTPPRVR
jgi:hypothetical protein